MAPFGQGVATPMYSTIFFHVLEVQNCFFERLANR